jgi:hypothetical protein
MDASARPIDPTIAYLEEAAGGSVDALAALRDFADDAAGKGWVTTTEAQIAATVYGHMAASFGDNAACRRLSDLLLRCGAGLRERGFVEEARHLDIEAVDLLHQLAALGDDRAAAAIVACEIVPASLVESEGERLARLKRRALFAGAARGDLAAASALIDQAVLESSDAFGGLVMAEQVARLGSAKGDLSMAGKLAGILYLRAMHELDGGSEVRALSCLSEAVSILIDCAAAGDDTVVPYLVNIAEQLNADCFAVLAAGNPTLLLYRTPQGAA